MIVYNVTVKIDNSVHADWLKWMKEVHIPDVMNTGFFTENKMFRVVTEDEDGVNYAIQYYVKDMKTLHEYYAHHAPRLQAEHTERYKDKYVAFRTILEAV